MPAIIGTAVPHDSMGNRLAVSIGSTVIDAGGVTPVPSVHSFQFTASRVGAASNMRIGTDSIDESWTYSGRSYRLRQIWTDPGRILLRFNSNQQGAAFRTSDLTVNVKGGTIDESFQASNTSRGSNGRECQLRSFVGKFVAGTAYTVTFT